MSLREALERLLPVLERHGDRWLDFMSEAEGCATAFAEAESRFTTEMRVAIKAKREAERYLLLHHMALVMQFVSVLELIGEEL